MPFSAHARKETDRPEFATNGVGIILSKTGQIEIPHHHSFHFRRDRLGLQTADGPKRKVSEGFRSAVLDTTALYGLISDRPEIAREVLLAVCIEEPTHSDPYSNQAISWDERLSLAHWQLGYPAMYWKGPFLNFLQHAPEQALDAIIRLVNYATKRLFEDDFDSSIPEDERKKFEHEFEFGGKAVRWLGDANVYGWHRYAPLPGQCCRLRPHGTGKVAL